MASREYRPTRRAPKRRLQARDVMSREPAVVTGKTSLAACAKLMLERGVSVLPVIDAERDVIGIVSDGDLLSRGAAEAATQPKSWLELFAEPRRATEAFAARAGRTAADVMTTRVICVRAETPIAEVSTILSEWKIKRVPVLADGRMVGIISRGDLARTMAKPQHDGTRLAASDHDIRNRLMAELKEQHGIPGAVEVAVSDGAVVLYGFASSPEEASTIALVAESLPGVRWVENYLRVGQHTKYRN